MHVEWYGQSAFRLKAGDRTVFIDPFGDMSSLAAARGMTWEYPAIEGVDADLLLVTHDHRDHNAVEVIGGSPEIVRTAGTHGDVIGIASEHDVAAGTRRGPNTIFAFTLDGVRVAHFGDFGQAALRDEQAEALGTVDLLFIPVGGEPDDRGRAGRRDRRARPGALDRADALPHRANRLPRARRRVLGPLRPVVRLESPRFSLDELPGERPLVVVPAAP